MKTDPESTTALITHEAVFKRLPFKECAPDNHNNREFSGFDKASMKELAASIALDGVVQNLIVYPAPDGKVHLIAAGERRYTAVGELLEAGVKKTSGGLDLTQLPCMIYKDATAARIAKRLQTIENLHHVHLHGLEEARDLAQLHADGLSIDTIAQDVGKSPAYVYGRIKLLACPKEIQDWAIAGLLNDSVLLLLSRIPDDKAKLKCAREILDPQRRGKIDEESEPMSFRQAKAHVKEHYMVRLKNTPFDQEDETLVVAKFDGDADGKPELRITRVFGGKCSDCPFRTGNMKKLQPDVLATAEGSADVCTLPACCAAKKAAAFKRKAEKEKKAGNTLLKSARGLIHSGTVYSSEFVDLKAVVPGDKKERTWEDVLGKALPEDGYTIALDPETNKRHVLLDVETLAPLAKAAGVKLKDGGTSSASPQESYQEQQKREAEERAAKLAPKQAVHEKLREQVIWKFAKLNEEEVWRWLCTGQDFEQFAAFGFKSAKEMCQKATATQLRTLYLVSRNPMTNYRGEWQEKFAELCDMAGVDLKALEKEGAKLVAEGKKNHEDTKGTKEEKK